MADVMLCRNPFVKAGAAFPCGQCDPCRFNRRRLWAHRIMLESLCHGDNAFVSLTYADDKLPLFGDVGTLVPDDLRLWLNRFRGQIAPIRVRFYGVGEYGGTTERPHYHVIVFGYPTCLRGRTLRRPETGDRPLWAECCSSCRTVGNSWNMGDVDLGSVTLKSANYVARYCVKGMTGYDDIRLHGRHPEFCRMSRQNGGIGSEAMWDVASTLMQYGLDEREDVPLALAYGRSTKQLGRYLRNKVRVMLGKEVGTPESVVEKLAEEMRPMREAAFNASSSFAKAIVEDSASAWANIDARNRIYKDRSLL